MSTNWTQVFASDDFRNLPQMEQFKFLRSYVPGFMDLPMKEQQKFYLSILPKSRFEEERTPKGSAFRRGVTAFGQGLSDIVSGKAGMTDPAKAAMAGPQAVLADIERKEEGRSKAYRGLAAGASILGISPEGMEEAGRRGDVAGVVGHAAAQAAPIAAFEAGRLAGPKIKATREPGILSKSRSAIAEGLRIPPVEEAAKLAGPNAPDAVNAAKDLRLIHEDLMHVENPNPV